MNHISKPGQHFGFPHCHGGVIADPDWGEANDCHRFVPPAATLPAHVAPLGMRFYTGAMFPKTYRNQILIAEHGSWNRSRKSGYRITRVRLKGDQVIAYEPFVQGWLKGNRASGRPVDLEVMNDGSLLVSDDQNGVIYRISSDGEAR